MVSRFRRGWVAARAYADGKGAFQSGESSERKGDLGSARRWYETAARYVAQGLPDEDVQGLLELAADVQGSIARVSTRVGDDDAAAAARAQERELLDQLAAATGVAADPHEHAQFLLSIAAGRMGRGHVDESVAIAEDVLARWTPEQLGLGLFGSAREYLAIVLERSGRWPEARLEAERALELAQGGWDPDPRLPQYASPTEIATGAWTTIAITWTKSGDFEKARHAYERAHELAAGAEVSDIQRSTVLVNLAEGIRELGDPQTAIARAEEALALPEEVVHPGTRHGALRLIGLCHLDMGDRAEARRFLVAANKTTPAASRDVETTVALAALLIEDGEGRRAVKELRRQLRFMTSESGQALVRAALAEARLSIGDVKRAREDVDSALGTLERQRVETPLLSDALTTQARLYRVGGDDGRAAAGLFRAIDVVERVRGRIGEERSRAAVFARQQRPYQDLITVLHDLGRYEEAFAVAERSRARGLLDLLGGQPVGRTEDPEVNELLRKERLLQHQLAALAFDPERVADERPLVDALEEVRRDLRRTAPELAAMRDVEPASLSGLQAALKDDQLLIEFDATGSDAFAWAVRRHAAAMVKLGRNGDDLANSVNRVLRSLRAPTEDADSPELAGLSRALLDPLPADLWAGVRRVVVAADGALHYLPFELLSHPEGGQLVERFAVSYAPSATVLLRLGQRSSGPARGNFAGFGDPAFAHRRSAGVMEHSRAADDLQLTPLPWAREEVTAIARRFGSLGRCFLGPDATEAAVKREARNAQYLHLATHGLLDDREPLWSGLALAPPTDAERSSTDDPLDDWLQAYEIFGMNLDSAVVVCSACETGLGAVREGEGLVGLTRAFLTAGARAVLVSLWRVADRPTALLMDGLYEELFAGRRLDEALAGAKATLMASPAFSAPYYWAGFVLVGDAG